MDKRALAGRSLGMARPGPAGRRHRDRRAAHEASGVTAGCQAGFGRGDRLPSDPARPALAAAGAFARLPRQIQGIDEEAAPGQWTYRVVTKHALSLEQDSLKTVAADRAARA